MKIFMNLDDWPLWANFCRFFSEYWRILNGTSSSAMPSHSHTNPTISIETVIKDYNIEYIPSIQIIKSVLIYYYYILHIWQSHMRAASASLPFDTTEKFCRINRTHTQPNQLLLIFIIINKYFQRIFMKIIIIIKIIVI